MKATGIVRRVDSLGRVVIPKEIRHTLRIREGTALEIYTDKDGGVTFRKYSPLGDLQELAGQVCEAIHRNTGCIAAVCDTDTIVAVSGDARRELLDRSSQRPGGGTSGTAAALPPPAGGTVPHPHRGQPAPCGGVRAHPVSGGSDRGTDAAGGAGAACHGRNGPEAGPDHRRISGQADGSIMYPRPAVMLGGGHLLYDDGVYSMGATSASVMVSPLSTRSMSREACSTVASSGYITDAVPAMVESMPPVPVTA